MVLNFNPDEQKIISWEEGWDYMQKGISKLKNLLDGLSKSPFSEVMMLYKIAYTMRMQKPPHDYSQQLYDNYRESFEEYITSTVLPSLEEKQGKLMLWELGRWWLNYKKMVEWLSSFFHFVEVTSLSEDLFTARRSFQPLEEVGFACFRDLVQVNRKVKEAVIFMIDQEREGYPDRALVKEALDILAEFRTGEGDYYKDDFESLVISSTEAYYKHKASQWITEVSIDEYMRRCEECLRREEDIAFHYLHFSSEPKLVQIVKRELLSAYATKLLEDNKDDDLLRMYTHLPKIPGGLDILSSVFKQHVTAKGRKLVEDAAASTNKAYHMVGIQEQFFVEEGIELYRKYQAYVNVCFLTHSLFKKAFLEAFEIFCNKGVAGSSSAELLATFCDNILKTSGSGKLSNEAFEDALEKVMKLLSYNNDKDLFAEFYCKKLARRLLFDKSANDEHEISILTKLKQQCGGQFTSKMEGMVTDMTLAKENQLHFEEYLRNNPSVSPGFDLSVTVLNSRSWPSYKSSDLNLPAEMVKCAEIFGEFYHTKSKNRKLRWICSLGTCHIIGKFEQKPVELIVTTFQASTLLLFNSSYRLSYQEIMTQLNLSDDDVVRLLHSLSCAKYNILLKEPNTKTISPTDYFEFNSAFTDKMRRIKIPIPPMHEKKKVIEDVDKDRRSAIDVSIIRIMKSRKVLRYQQLVMECVEQLGHMFKPDGEAIKKRIDDLITQEYLERDAEEPNLFRYLA